jgi:hypothetical protein
VAQTFPNILFFSVHRGEQKSPHLNISILFKKERGGVPNQQFVQERGPHPTQGGADNQQNRKQNLSDILRGTEGVEPDVDIQAMIKREAGTPEDSVVATFLAEQVKGGGQALENNTVAVLPKVP